MHVISMGVDPSTKKTGVLILKGCVTDQPELLHEELIKPKAKFSHKAKQEFMVNRVLELIKLFNPSAITIEGYGLNLRNASAIVPLVELGGVLRFHIYKAGHGFLSPSPSEVKKFATEKGNTDKDGMVNAANRLYGYETDSDDKADAFFLSLIGLAFANALGGMSLKQREVIGQLNMY